MNRRQIKAIVNDQFRRRRLFDWDQAKKKDGFGPVRFLDEIPGTRKHMEAVVRRER